VTPPTQQSGRGGFLSDVIVELGFADRATVEQAVRAARSPGTTVARVLVERGDITEDQLAHATAERHGLAYVDLDAYDVEPAAANLLDPAASRRYQAVGIACAEGSVLVAMADPADPLSIKDISELTGMSVVPAVAPAPAILALVDQLPLPGTERGPVALPTEAAPTEAPPRPAPAPGPPSELESTRARLAETAGDLEAQARATVELELELESLRGRLAAMEDERERAVEDARRLEGRVEELRAAPQAPPREDAEPLRRRLEAAEDELAELEDVRARLADAERALEASRGDAARVEALTERLTTAQSELENTRRSSQERERELRAAQTEVEARSSELAVLRDKLTGAETDAVRRRAEADARRAELESARARTEAAERAGEDARARAAEAQAEAEAARTRSAEAERAAQEARVRVEELQAADRRAEQARLALAALREESEREREHHALEMRDLRAKAGSEERRRRMLEERLSEVEGGVFAAERAFEEMRQAQRRMRGSLRALTEPDPADDPHGPSAAQREERRPDR
jgi:hypothetical protein